MDSKRITTECPKCDSMKNVACMGRVGGISGYNDLYKCRECGTEYAIMYMYNRPPYKLITKEKCKFCEEKITESGSGMCKEHEEEAIREYKERHEADMQETYRSILADR